MPFWPPKWPHLGVSHLALGRMCCTQSPHCLLASSLPAVCRILLLQKGSPHKMGTELDCTGPVASPPILSPILIPALVYGHVSLPSAARRKSPPAVPEQMSAKAVNPAAPMHRSVRVGVFTTWAYVAPLNVDSDSETSALIPDPYPPTHLALDLRTVASRGA